MQQTSQAASRRDVIISLLTLSALLAWDYSGLDLVLTRWVATPEGFPWRDNLWASGVLHSGGRALGWAMLALLLLDAIRPLGPGPSRKQRARGIAVVLAGLVLVPLLKRFNATSCPWDLAEFGGQAAYVPHWLLGVTDAGPGHCFPSGHAVAAFAFFGAYFTWRHQRPRLARLILAAVLVLGVAFGWAQWIRGAHFVSHTLWSAWLCWVIGAVTARLWPADSGSAAHDRTAGR
jgi:membrane-associated PAP2 superfamily phosphatase